MLDKIKIISVVLTTALFTMLFHGQTLGLNLLLFEIPILFWLYYKKSIKLTNFAEYFSTIALLITLISIIFNFSIFAFFIHFICAIFFIGVHSYPLMKNPFYSVIQSLENIVISNINFFKTLVAQRTSSKSIFKIFNRIVIFVLPVIISIIFISIYRSANPIFNQSFVDFFKYLSTLNINIDYLFSSGIIFTIIAGWFFSNYIYMSNTISAIVKEDDKVVFDLNRKKRFSFLNFKMNALKTELKIGIILFFMLNVILLSVNIIDIYWVWYNFEWKGEYLRQFVHEGTYMLIFSIIISSLLVLYYFRGNLNFFSKNKYIKLLSYIWLWQNAVLAISVAIRNYWYINHFALAYKRIGVVIFLLLVLWGLYSTFRKVYATKTLSYIVKTNIYSLIAILVITSSFNWDLIIAKYNFKHYKTAYIELYFLEDFSDSALPYLDKTESEVEKIIKYQEKILPKVQYYPEAKGYVGYIKSRKKWFKTKWEKKSFLEWNYPEYIAYKKLYGNQR